MGFRSGSDFDGRKARFPVVLHQQGGWSLEMSHHFGNVIIIPEYGNSV